MKKGVLIFLAVLLFLTSYGISQTPSSTECTSSDTSACQKPFYTDDQNQYLYDDDASWVFSGGSSPDSSGPTTFFGSLANDTSSTEQDTSDSGNLKEKLIQNPGSAEGGSQNNFGRGSFSTNSISSISDQDIDSNSYGEDYVVTPPNQGMCGDGVKQSNEDGSSCPEDAGLPKVVLDGQDKPSRTAEFWEKGSASDSFDKDTSPSDVKVDGDTPPNNFPDRYTDGSYIIEVTKSANVATYDTDTLRHFYVGALLDGSSGGFKDGSTQTIDTATGADKQDTGNEYCTSISAYPFRYKVGTSTFNSKDVTVTKDADYYSPVTQTTTSDDITWDITYNDGFTPGEQLYECSGTTKQYDCPDGCQDDLACECEAGQEEYYYDYTGSIEVVSNGTIDLKYDEYESYKSKIWGPVNSELEFSGLSNVIDGSGGYFAYGSPVDSREASNDPSVSKTTYNLIEGSTYFEAKPSSITVLDADGQNGRSNGIVAYNEDSDSIAGSSEGFMNSELVDGVVDTFLIESEVRNKISCPEDRCLASVDITTERSGWDHPVSSPGTDSYSASIDSTVSVTDSAGACETYKNLTGVSDEELDCSPGPNFDVCGAYEEEQKIYFEGPDVKDRKDEYQAHYEACLRPQNTDTENMCVLPDAEHGTSKVEEGVVRDLTPEYHNETYQKGGQAADPSICLNIDGDKGGEWYNLDDWDATDYVRDKINSNGGTNSDALKSDEWISYWINEHPNQDALPDAVSPEILEDPVHGTKGGFNLEEDCHPDEDCSPVYGMPFDVGDSGNFRRREQQLEATDNDDYHLNLTSLQTQVMTDKEYGLDSQNNQYIETKEDLGTLDNSRIDKGDDQWALAPNASYAVNNYGEPRRPYRCHGQQRKQGKNFDKIDKDYANSYASTNEVTSGGKNYKVGNWMNPDVTNRSAKKGLTSCDLTGEDWGYGYDPTVERDITVLYADFYYKPEDPSPAETIDFDASPSTYSEGSITSYRWDLNQDGSTDKTGKEISKTWFSVGCRDVTMEIETGDGETANTTKQVCVAGALLEQGGQETGEINGLEIPEPSNPTNPAMRLADDGDGMCFGSRCTEGSGSDSSGYDSDVYVNQSGDGMTGSLHIGEFQIPSGEDVCIGSRCADNLDRKIAPSGPALSDENNETGSDFILDVDNIIPLEDGLRIK